VAKEIENKGSPIRPPCVLIVGGETTVTIECPPGEGGRNQEFALAASLKVEESRGIVIASIGTDGTDGPTDIAGGIVDGYTVKRAKEKEIDLFENLRRHNSSYVFRQLDDAIFTGPTGTNVMDLRLLVVGASNLHESKD
jgi:glycerate-2-kinase